jgi:hypothetical protein
MGMKRSFKWKAHRIGVGVISAAGLAGVLAMATPGRPLTGREGDSTAAGGDSAAHSIPARLLGLSGRLRTVEVAPLAALVPGFAQVEPGLHTTGLTAPDGEPIQALALVPLRAKQGANWQRYRVGFWPGERSGQRSRSRYPLPDGFLEVTPENQDLPLTTHFRVRDFLTHDQPDTWPKVLVIQLPLLDKLELIRGALEALGKPAEVRVMSGFRTPQYNALGVERGGRARNSRHMYGDAADIFVDADGDGRMDDLNGDGPFVHVDARGTPARW